MKFSENQNLNLDLK